MAIGWDKFVIDAWNLIWIRRKPTCILTCVVFLSSWLTHRIILTTFSIAWHLFQAQLLQSSLLNLCVLILALILKRVTL